MRFLEFCVVFSPLKIKKKIVSQMKIEVPTYKKNKVEFTGINLDEDPETIERIEPDRVKVRNCKVTMRKVKVRNRKVKVSRALNRSSNHIETS